MTALPTEEEAVQEIADIDALLAEAQATMTRLRERRAQLVPVSQATQRRLAVAVHAVFCGDRWHRGDDCGFRKGPWTEWNGHRASWVSKAKQRLDDSSEEPEAFLEALRTLASHDQLEKIREETEKVAEVEREALEPKKEEEAA